MGSADLERDVVEEARELAASGAALLRELVEEGVGGFERLAVEAPTAPRPRTIEPSPRPSQSSHPSRPRPPRPPIEPASFETARRATAPPTTTVRPLAASADGRPTLESVRTELGDCRRCGLCEGRQKIVFGDGNPRAEILFVGEGPGEQEDRTGLPFVGRAGELLTQMIEKGMGIPRADVYICNIVKCRPPGNRNPLPPEVSACRPFLDGQIAAVAPKVIVTLGKPAASLLLDREISITRLRGTWQDYHGIPLMPTLHPAYVLRQYTPENRRAVWQDLKAALERARA
ncbi:uracil-DNA glycosylase [Myxococcota bacterium]|nr:uracil-DNA glycosylase [Myxococcota bacterium]